MSDALIAHLESGATQVCQCWRITRRDGVVQGFTDHDLPLEFEGTVFEAESGLGARAVQHTSGLSADNSAVVGALQSEAITADLLRSGVYDEAALEIWQVYWPNPDLRALRFRGAVGEITITGDAFTAEIRGLSDKLNPPFGRVIQSGCSAVLGDGACGVDMNDPAHFAELEVTASEDGRVFLFSGTGGIAAGRFERGRMRIIDGTAAGQTATIKRHEITGAEARVELWEPLRRPPRSGDLVRCEVGCDKTLATCRDRFANLSNFRGFPHVPGDDWLMAYPRAAGGNTGGSLLS
ncbi:MAG: DUF2163 domain-containing protein [Rhodobacteraceae bacterium]|nr:DUF2163 domain-containing protein [Paracoccaceae bacterium]